MDEEKKKKKKGERGTGQKNKITAGILRSPPKQTKTPCSFLFSPFLASSLLLVLPSVMAENERERQTQWTRHSPRRMPHAAPTAGCLLFVKKRFCFALLLCAFVLRFCFLARDPVFFSYWCSWLLSRCVFGSRVTPCWLPEASAPLQRAAFPSFLFDLNR